MEPADSYRYSLIVPEGGEQEQDWMWFAPFGDAFSLLLVVRRFHDLRSFHQRLLKVGPLRGPEVIRQAYGAYPLGVPPDLKSGVKKCPNLFRLCGFAIRSKGVCFSFCWGITNPPVLIGRTFFYGGFQIISG